MPRSKLLALVFGLALVSLAFVLPHRISATQCVCPGSNRTPTAGCSAGSCTAAEDCLFSYLDGLVDCSGTDGLCSETLIITDACFQPAPGSYQVNGYMRYKCQICP
ncbi:MAG TPA: hypothetical protein VF173_31590 [Thermoanaerobaculia bacterium]|nr:hypothetical protein [Thermoanaerobaculia bacterium]